MWSLPTRPSRKLQLEALEARWCPSAVIAVHDPAKDLATLSPSSNPTSSSTTPSQRFTSEQKSLFTDVGTRLAELGALFLIVGTEEITISYPVFGINGTATFTNQTREVQTPLGDLGAQILVVAHKFLELAEDPPDSNFTTVAQPNPPTFTSVTAQGSITNDEAAALNALFKANTQAIGFAIAARIAVDRASGAQLAGDSSSESLQAQAIKQFSTQLGQVCGGIPNLLANLQQTGLSATVTNANLTAFQTKIRNNGLPANITQRLQQLGADTSLINRIQQSIVSASSTNIVGSLPGTLSNAQLVSALQKVTQSLAGTTGTAVSTASGSTGSGTSSSTSSASVSADAARSAANIAALEALLNGPLVKPIAFAQITNKTADLNSDGLPDVRIMLGLNVKVRGVAKVQRFEVSFNSLDFGVIGTPTNLGVA